MRDFDEHNISDAVIDQFSKTPDPRLKEIVTSLTRHLHDFVRDIELTMEEWQYAVEFLTRTGQISVNGRQEFILLSDVLGVSMLVDAINHRMPEGATATTVLGPFHVPAPPMDNGADISGGVPGIPVYVDVEIRSAAGLRLAGATVDVWQSDSEGFYDIQQADMAGRTNLRGEFLTGADGKVSFWSITPTAYPIPYDGPVGDLLKATGRHPWRPAHLHFMISAPGYETLVTHIFVNGDQYLESDAVFGVKNALIHDFPFQNEATAPDGRVLKEPWRQLTWTFGLKEAGK